MSDIAAKAGVSRTTVSRVLSGNSEKVRISEETAKKILGIAEKLNFRPDALARGLKLKNTHTIGVIVPDITNPFFAEIGRSLESFLDKNEYSMILMNSDDNEVKEKKCIDLLLSKRVDGLVISPAGYEDENIALLAKEKVPFVLVDRMVKNVRCSYVVSDNYNGSKTAVSYLIGLGHKRIGFVGGRVNTSINRERRQGYLDTLKENGITPDIELDISIGFNREAGERSMDMLLKVKEPPTAVFVANNFLGIGVMLSLRKNRVKVPGEMSVIEFDDTDFSRLSDVAVTSITQDTARIGEKGAQILLNKIGGNNREEKIVLPVILAVRESTKKYS